ncbi:MBL fold metallo-hydrolase [Pseudactinotalea sp. HY158]|nr:MBL fold metallo-hydrolase [Pseudactinotalea sp. HY158]
MTERPSARNWATRCRMRMTSNGGTWARAEACREVLTRLGYEQPPHRPTGASMLEVVTSAVMRTNSVVISHGDDVIVVDPAWTTAELDRLAARLRGRRVVCGWSTHAHHDHMLWHPGLGAGPRYATPAAARLALEHQPKLQQAATAHVSWELVPHVGRVEVYEGRTLDWDGPRVEIVTHDGHSPGHGALWLPAERVLVAGDMLSDVEIPLLAETGPAAYREGLARLEPYVRAALEVVPGHGGRCTSGVADSPIARWEADLAYFDAVEAGRGHDDPRLGAGPAWLWDAHTENLLAAGRRP